MSKEKDDGHIHVRNGLLEHVQKGWMDEQMYLAYSVMLHQCDWATGVWLGCALRLQAAIPAWSLSTCRRVLNRLQRGLYCESEHDPGVRGNYRVLISNYEPTVGKSKGRLRPTETQDWREAVAVTGDSLTVNIDSVHSQE